MTDPNSRFGLIALKEHVFDNEKPIPPKKPTMFDLVEMDDGQETLYPVLSSGGIVGITGKTGTAKSTILSILHTAFFSKSKEYMNFRCNVEDGGSMLWIDTEMSESSDFLYFQKGLHERLGVKQNLPLYRGVNLKYCHSNMNRFETLIDILDNVNNKEESDYFDNLKVIMLDGIADLLTDTNNESEAREKLNLISSKADQKGIGIVTVLHTDKQGRHARGFAGSMLENEAQLMMRTSRFSQNEPFKVECDKIRGSKPFHPFYFDFHDDGINLVLQDDTHNILLDFMCVSESSGDSSSSKYKLI